MSLPALYSQISDVREAVQAARRHGKRIGLVPTMGALHAGHASLMMAARQATDFVVATIFVNPMQFGPAEDLDRYPRTLDSDRRLCAAVKVDALFVPDVSAVYPENFFTSVEVSTLQDALCGASRPGHFRGVCTVVLKLFNIVQPDAAFFGQKDAQQALIVTRMVRELNLPIDMHILPTVREADGLALSSRNRHLNASQRAAAPAIYRALQDARQRIADGERSALTLESILCSKLASIPGARVDYARIVSAKTLAPIDPLCGQILVAVAVHLGETRLIDNVLVDLV